MLTGKKLLVADDSVAIQKVVDLTFTDEGMEVTAVGDGNQARSKLEETTPDIVLADAFMPGIDGYELCRIIRASERLKHIPVMLLVGSFEPFDEAEARRAGASAVVTKPFQSIRDLVSRVGSLLSGKSEDDGTAGQYSTLGLGRTDEDTPAAPIETPTTEPDLKVFVEAPLPVDESMQDANINVMVEAAPIPEHESAEIAGASCVADVEMQTADTQQMERVSDEEFGITTDPGIYAQDDTIEIEPVDVEKDMDPSMNVSAVTERPWNANEPRTPRESAETYSDALLDLGEFNDVDVRALDEDVVLDLDFEAPLPSNESWPESVVGTLSSAPAAVVNGSPATYGVGGAQAVPAEQVVASEVQTEPQPEVSRWGVAHPPADVPPANAGEKQTVEPVVDRARPLDLSPETIDAIARRVVEQMSERVVREIAWEVVPDLAELLIKERLDKQD